MSYCRRNLDGSLALALATVDNWLRDGAGSTNRATRPFECPHEITQVAVDRQSGATVIRYVTPMGNGSARETHTITGTSLLDALAKLAKEIQ